MKHDQQQWKLYLIYAIIGWISSRFGLIDLSAIIGGAI